MINWWPSEVYQKPQYDGYLRRAWLTGCCIFSEDWLKVLCAKSGGEIVCCLPQEETYWLWATTNSELHFSYIVHHPLKKSKGDIKKKTKKLCCKVICLIHTDIKLIHTKPLFWFWVDIGGQNPSHWIPVFLEVR